MKLLFNHVDQFAYRVTEQTAVGTALDDDERAGETGPAVLVKVCTESSDTESTVEQAVEEIRDVLSELAVDRVVLFPWAHLSTDLAAPEDARSRLTALETALEAAGYSVVAVPFGWYKSWELESKGHPMSVLSRSI